MSSNAAIPIGDVLDIVRQRVTDPEALKQIVADLNAAQKELAAEKAAEKATGPKNKYRLVALVRGDASLKPLLVGGAFVLAVPDTDGPESSTYTGDALLQRLYKAVRTYNEAPKGKRGKARSKIKTLLDAMRMLKPKMIKESESAFKVKAADPIEIIVVEREEVDGS